MNQEKVYRKDRQNMVREQLIPRGIRDEKVLEAFRSVPRHRFVPEEYRNISYGDHPLGIGEGQTISQPYVVALMTEALELKGKEKVLEIGTGSGYQSAVLAELAGTVYTVERMSGLQKRARRILEALGCDNIRYRVGDGSRGWPEEAPFEGILVTAAPEKIPGSLVEQLAPGGRMILPVGPSSCQKLTLVTRKEEGLAYRDLGGCRFVPLVES